MYWLHYLPLLIISCTTGMSQLKTEQEAWWSLKLVWWFRRRENFLPLLEVVLRYPNFNNSLSNTDWKGPQNPYYIFVLCNALGECNKISFKRVNIYPVFMQHNKSSFGQSDWKQCTPQRSIQTYRQSTKLNECSYGRPCKKPTRLLWRITLLQNRNCPISFSESPT